MNPPSSKLYKLAIEPPFRFFIRYMMNWLPVSIHTQALWSKSLRPQYLNGVLFAAEQARIEGLEAISVIEFGVAQGAGLLELERIAADVEKATGIRILVYGFDSGPDGLPDFIGDHRDCPDIWRPGDYPMDVNALRAKLSPRTTLVLGNIRDTVPRFIAEYDPPTIGFIAVDVDLYSSTAWALQILTQPDKRILMHLPMYFDDIDMWQVHRYAGELLAVDEFNAREADVKIVEWRGLRNGRPFHEEAWLGKMFLAHDLAAIARCRLDRDRWSRPGRQTSHAGVPSKKEFSSRENGQVTA